MRTALACTLAAGVVMAGCGGSSAGVPLAAQDSATLRNDVSAIRTAAAASNPSDAHAAAARLKSDVQRLLDEGRLSSADARSMLIVVAQVDNRISAEVHAPTPATTTPAPVTTAAPTTASPTVTPASPPAHTPAPTLGPPGHAAPGPQAQGHPPGPGGGKHGGH